MIIKWFVCFKFDIIPSARILLAHIGTYDLTYCGLVMPYGNIDLSQYWLQATAWWHQAIAWTNVYFTSVRFCSIHSPESNFRVSAHATIRYNEFENYMFKITATSPRGYWVKKKKSNKTETLLH